MPKLPLLNLDDLVAIDIHTHAEEPCGIHGDDGYDDFQAAKANARKLLNIERRPIGRVSP
jgi:hypothetical protein